MPSASQNIPYEAVINGDNISKLTATTKGGGWKGINVSENRASLAISPVGTLAVGESGSKQCQSRAWHPP
jgi:hypothetical protein